MALPAAIAELEQRISNCKNADGLDRKGTRLILSLPSDVSIEWAQICQRHKIELPQDQQFNEDIAQLGVLDNYDAGRALYVAYMGCFSLRTDPMGDVADALDLSCALALAALDYYARNDCGRFFARLQKSAIQNTGLLSDSRAYIETIINEIANLRDDDNNRKSPPKA